MSSIDNLRSLIEKVRNIGFFGRLFGWKRVKDQVIDAVGDLERLVSNATNSSEQVVKLETARSNILKDLELAKSLNERLSAETDSLKSTLKFASEDNSKLKINLSSKETTIENQALTASRLESDLRLLKHETANLLNENTKFSEDIAASKEVINKISERKVELEISVKGLTRDLENTRQERDNLRDRVTQFVTEEESRKIAHEASLSSLREIKEQIQADRNREVEERSSAEIERIRKLKEIWKLHQESVNSAIRTLCAKHIVEYVEQVPFAGSPDNTIKICEEFIVLDAKSPGGDDLTNFPAYLKDQAEKAGKYARIEGVKPEIYFVVPTSTLECLNKFVFNLGDYDVHIVSFDSLEQIILSLKKIEEYEFIDTLSPEERDSICRVVGRFVHLTKRRIQVDTYFVQEALDYVFKSEQELPEDFLQEVLKYESAEKLNPPTEKRAKVIDLAELREKTRRLRDETISKGIVRDPNRILAGVENMSVDSTQLVSLFDELHDDLSETNDPK